MSDRSEPSAPSTAPQALVAGHGAESRLDAATRSLADAQASWPAPVLRCRRLRPEAVLPRRAHPSDAGLDLVACEGSLLAPGARATVGCGFALELAPGYAGLVLPRSGLATRHGVTLANAPGLIDPGYRGEVRVALINLDRERAFEVRPGDRVAQLLVVPFALVEPLEVAELAGSERGERGFGSTGLRTARGT